MQWQIPKNQDYYRHKEGKAYREEEMMQRGDVTVTKIASAENLADPFTKTLPAKVFNGHLDGLGLRDMSHLL